MPAMGLSLAAVRSDHLTRGWSARRAAEHMTARLFCRRWVASQPKTHSSQNLFPNGRLSTSSHKPFNALPSFSTLSQAALLPLRYGVSYRTPFNLHKLRPQMLQQKCRTVAATPSLVVLPDGLGGFRRRM